MDEDARELIKLIIFKINDTLALFKPDYTRAKRTDELSERCSSLDQYIECRFNFECSKIPKLNGLIERTEGKLFSCTVEDPNVSKNRFKIARITVNEETQLEGDESLKNEIADIINWLGGDTVEFTHKKKKFTFNIKNSKNNKN